MAVGQQIAPIMAFPEAGILPPGWYLDATGALRQKGWDTTNNRELVTVDLLTATQGGTNLGNMSRDANRVATGIFPEKWSANGTEMNPSTSLPSPWKAFYKSQALVAGAAADVQLIAGVAGSKFDVVVAGFDVLAPTDSTTVATVVGTFQDSANAAVVGALTVQTMYKWAATAASFAGQTYQRYPFPTLRFETVTDGLALEVDWSGGLGTEVCVIWGLYREL